MIEPYPTRDLSAADVAWRNVVLGTRRSISLSVHQTPLELRFHDGREAAEAELLVQVSIGGVRFWIGFADWNRLPGVTEFLDGALVSGIPSDLLPAVLEAVFEQPLNQLGTLASARATVATADASVADLESFGRIGISLTIDGADKPLHGFVAGDDAAMNRLRGLIETAPPEAASLCGELPLVAGVEIGATQLTIDELERLKLHDVLMLETTTFDDSREGLIRFSPTCTWNVGIADNQATCLERLDESPTEILHGDGVSVKVTAESGHVRCTVDQLSDLQPDSLLTIADGERISLKSGGSPIARGELVRIAERLGVRLLSRPIAYEPDESPAASEPEAGASLDVSQTVSV